VPVLCYWDHVQADLGASKAAAGFHAAGWHACTNKLSYTATHTVAGLHCSHQQQQQQQQQPYPDEFAASAGMQIVPSVLQQCMLLPPCSVTCVGKPQHDVLFSLQGCSSEALARTKTDYDAFLADPTNLKAVKEQLQVGRPTAKPAVASMCNSRHGYTPGFCVGHICMCGRPVLQTDICPQQHLQCLSLLCIAPQSVQLHSLIVLRVDPRMHYTSCV
jgi:hypothetical protein